MSRSGFGRAPMMNTTKSPSISAVNLPLFIEGTEEEVVSLARCCMPIPGDNVQGFLTSGKGVIVHRAGCHNVGSYRRRPKEWVPVEWSSEYSGEYQANIAIELRNTPGSLARVATTLSQMNTNIENMRFETSGESLTRIVITLTVRDRKHMARVIRRLRNLPVVERIKRESR